MSINELFQKANKLFIQNNYIDGLKIYIDVLSKYPLSVRLSEELKKTTKKYKKTINQTVTDQEISNFFEMQRLNKGGDVIKILDANIKKTPNDILLTSLLGTFNALERNYDKAIIFQKKAIEMAPFEISFYQNLSTTLRKTNKHNDALSMLYFAKVLSLNNKSIDLEIAKLNTLIKNFNASDLIFANLIKDKNLSEEIMHHYCMNLIGWEKEDKVISFLKDFNQPSEMKSLLLGLSNYNLSNFETAKKCFLDAIDINENSFIAYSHLGNCYQALGYTDKAENCHKQSLKIKPKNKIGLNNLAALWSFIGDIEKAENTFIESINENEENYEAHYYLGVCQLAKSNYAEGWLNYSFRWLHNNFDSDIFKTKLPNFTLKTDTKNLIIWDEQGIGDTILFLRFLNDIKSLVDKIYMSVDLRLHPIIKRFDPDILFYDKNDIGFDIKNFNHQIPIGDLGSLFVKENSYFLKKKKTYINSNREIKSFLENKFKDQNKFKCGISWVSINKTIGSAKSITLNDLKPILSIPNITFIDLQYNDTKKERESFYKNTGIKVNKVDEIDHWNDVDGVVSLIDTCDFIITISNSNAHFAGALGKETYLLLPNGKGRLWYWMYENNSSIWYPSIQVIEQKETGSWDDVIRRLEKDIKEKVE